jgi:hypothetical protein
MQQAFHSMPTHVLLASGAHLGLVGEDFLALAPFIEGGYLRLPFL